MLNQSILGALYRCWLGSGTFALLRRVWYALTGVLKGEADPDRAKEERLREKYEIAD